MRYLKRLNSPMGTFVSLTIIIFALIIIMPGNQVVMQNHSLSPHQYRILLFVVELPLMAVWFAAFYAYAKLREYAQKVRSSAEGHGYAKLAEGAKWLAWGLMVPSIIGLLLNGIANRHPAFRTFAIVTVNYLYVLFPLIAFSLFATGANRLLVGQRLRASITTVRLAMLGFITLGAVYCFLVLSHLDINSHDSAYNPYFLPLWAIVFTIVIPNLFAWFSGLLAAQQLHLVSRHVKGVIYRQALSLLASGLGLVIAALIAVEYLHSVIPRTGRLALSNLLVVIYLIYLVGVIGFGLISLGARRLKKIEEI